jgi:hypothetical protein
MICGARTDTDMHLIHVNVNQPGCLLQSFRSKANEAADDGADTPALKKEEQKAATPLAALWFQPFPWTYPNCSRLLIMCPCLV